MDYFSTKKESRDKSSSSNIKNEEVFEYYYKKIVIKDYESQGSSITHIEWFSRTTKRNRESNSDEEDDMCSDKHKYKKQK